MSYIVLARKWRPQVFEDLIGQQAIAKTLANSIRIGRIGHAFLFCGPRGIGKTSAARILSKALSCEHGPTPTPCNACRFCEEITQGTSLDILEIDGASNRGIDEIRELRDNIKYAPASARFKITIIDEVHMLTREAFNALLKTLEEPPPHAKFILATTEAHKVPVTIISRCQRYDFRRISFTDICNTLTDICRKENIQIEQQTLEVIAKIADGSLRDGLSVLDQVISFSGNTVNHAETMALLGRVDPNVVSDVMRALAAGDGGAALDRFGKYVENGGDEIVFNRELMEFTRDFMALKLGGSTRVEIPSDLTDSFSIDQLERFFKIQLDLETTLRNSEHPRLLMDAAIIKMSRIQSLTPIETLINQLKPFLSGRVTPPIKKNTHTDHPGRMENPPSKPIKRNIPTQPRPTRSSKPTTPSPQKTPPSQINPPVSPKARTNLHGNALLAAIMDAFPKKNALLRACLEFGAIVSESDTQIVIAFKPENEFYLNRINTPTGLAAVEKAAARTLGRIVRVRFVEGAGPVPMSIDEEKSHRLQKEQDYKHNVALQNPFIADMVNKYGGKINKITLRKKLEDTEI